MSPCGGHLAVGICWELIGCSSTSINNLIIVSSLHASWACFLSYLVKEYPPEGSLKENPELVLELHIIITKEGLGSTRASKDMTYLAQELRQPRGPGL